MKKINILIFCFSILLSFTACSKIPMSKIKTLGTEKFTVEKWKSASQEGRGKILYSFLKQYNVIGMKSKEIVFLLGEPTSYYGYESDPAYIVGPKNVESIAGRGYLIAFPTNKNTGKVISFVIKPTP